MTTAYFAKFDYADPPQPTALFGVIDGGLAFYFDKAQKGWVLDMPVLWRTQEDVDVWPITADQAAVLEARFRAA